jgi:hypothetical protein
MNNEQNQPRQGHQQQAAARPKDSASRGHDVGSDDFAKRAWPFGLLMLEIMYRGAATLLAEELNRVGSDDWSVTNAYRAGNFKGCLEEVTPIYLKCRAECMEAAMREAEQLRLF